MGSYVNNSLVDNESIVFEGSFALWDNFFWIVVSAGILIPIIYIYQKFSEIVITNHRVIGKKGIIRRETYEYGLNKIESIDVKQSILGRIFGYGDVVLTGSGSSSLVIPAIKSPENFKKKINETRYN